MSNIVIAGDTSGSVTLQAPAVAGGTVVTLPATTGTAALTSQVVGVGQTWQDVKTTPGRLLNTNYTNNTGKPIFVAVSATFAYPNSITFLVDSVQVDYQIESYTNSLQNTVTALVPNGSVYRVNSSGTLTTWAELR